MSFQSKLSTSRASHIPCSGAETPNETLGFDEQITFTGPCVLAFDGEREREIQDGQKVTMRVSRNGPGVLDINRTMQLAACRQWFRQ